LLIGPHRTSARAKRRACPGANKCEHQQADVLARTEFPHTQILGKDGEFLKLDGAGAFLKRIGSEGIEQEHRNQQEGG
jgi:hypothetical protein